MFSKTTPIVSYLETVLTKQSIILKERAFYNCSNVLVYDFSTLPLPQQNAKFFVPTSGETKNGKDHVDFYIPLIESTTFGNMHTNVLFYMQYIYNPSKPENADLESLNVSRSKTLYSSWTQANNWNTIVRGHIL